MIHLDAGTALRHIRSLIAKHGSIPDSDHQLLQRFINRAEHDAFAALVQRHGPMVMRICRDVLRQEHAAEDAFQATFLVLAKKAASIYVGESLGGWLRGVAQRVALKARARASRFPVCMPVPEAGVTDDPLADMTVREARVLLYEELQRLPAKYREPLCLCYLEGKTRDEAAHLLQWPLGTFNSRIDRARELLRGRLTRRGVTLSVVLFTAALSGRSAAAIPKAMAEATIQAAVRQATGQAVTDIVSAEAVALAQGMLPATMAKANLLAAVVLALGVFGTAFGVATQVATADKQASGTAQDDRPAAGAAPAPLLDHYGDPLPDNALARMGTIRSRQADIFFIACLPDGKTVITASRDGSIRLGDTETGKEIRRLSEASAPAAEAANPIFAMVTAPFLVAVSPDGKLLATARTSENALTRMMMAGPAPADAKPPKPEQITVRVQDVATGKDLSAAIRCEPATITALTFSPDSKTLAVAQETGLVHMYDVVTGRECTKVGRAAEGQKQDGEWMAVSDCTVAFSADGNTLLVVESGIRQNKLGYTARSWDVKNGKEIRQLKLPEIKAMRVMIAPDAKTLAWLDDRDIVLWSADQVKELRRLKIDGQIGTAFHLTFSSDGKHVAGRLPDCSIRLWEVATGTETARLAAVRQAPENGIRISFSIPLRVVDLAFSADGKTLVSAGKDSTIRAWDLTTNKERSPAAGHQGAVTRLALSPDGKVLTTRGGDGTVRQWDTSTGRQLREFRLMAGAAAGTFSSDGLRFAMAGPDTTVCLWDVAADKELWKIDCKVRTTDLAFSPDGTVLAVMGVGHVIQLWDAATGKALLSMQKSDEPETDILKIFFAPNPDKVGLLYSPDGRLLASVENKGTPHLKVNGAQAGGDDPAIFLWNPATGKLVRKLEMERATSGATVITFSPDSRMLAAAYPGGRVCVWELATGKMRFEFKEEVDSPSAMAWSPDGKTLVLGSADRTIYFRDVVSGGKLGQFSGHSGTVGALTFAAHGRALYSASDDTTALAWNLRGLKKAEPAEATGGATDQELEAMWTDLRGNDAAKAWKAIDTLSRAKPAPALLRDRLKPVAAVKSDRLAALVAALGSARFEERSQATAQLEELGDLAVAVLRKALDGQPTLEMRQRIEGILGNVQNKQSLQPEQLQALRALEVLERIGTAPAAQVLEVLAKGAPGARLTREAQATLDRLKKQPTRK